MVFGIVHCMGDINLQIRISRELNSKLTRFAKGSKSDFVREALEEKLQKETARRLEEQWIAALKKKRDTSADDDAWSAAEAWGEP